MATVTTERVRLGLTDMFISPVGFGAWAAGGTAGAFGWGEQDDEQTIAAIHRAVELGINWIDTAPVYGAGHSETVVGRAIALLPPTDRPLVFTKCGLVWDSPKQMPRRSGTEIRREIEASLKRLKIEWIDLYQMHWPAENAPIEEYWKTLLDLKKEGKVRAVGLSNHSGDLLTRAEAIGHVDTLQPPFSAIRRDFASNELPWCRQHETGVIVYSPMQAGLLTGQFTIERVRSLPKEDWRAGHPQFAGERLASNLKLAEAFKMMAARRGVTAAAMSVAWTLSWPGVTGAIVGARSADQVEGWSIAAQLRLSLAEMADIAQAIKAAGVGSGPEAPVAQNE